MKTREKFDLLETEIGDGAMLIEASAGTGKTFTIAFLVLRLLLERPELTIDRILVTTFTELATAELRGRIRERIRDALAVFRGQATDDELLAELRERHRSDVTAVGRLEAALVNFDEAPIYTIHGFCQRVLAERAFESATLFDAEMLTNQRELLREIVHDFWRTRFYTGERLPALLALRGKISPKGLFKDIEELTKNPGLIVLPEKFRAYSEIAADIARSLALLRTAWAKEKASIYESVQQAEVGEERSRRQRVYDPAARPSRAMPRRRERQLSSSWSASRSSPRALCTRTRARPLRSQSVASSIVARKSSS